MMEVAGKLKDDFTKSSDDDSTPVCQPCNNEGAHRMAQGYCKTCDEFLCTQCYKAHTIPTLCRNHVMLDKTQMPTKSSQASRPVRPSPCTIPCTDHPEMRIEVYCQDHKTVVCGLCSVLYHNKPCELKHILDMKNILNYKDTTNFQDIVRRLGKLEQDINAIITDLCENVELTEEQINAAIEKLRAFRKEIGEHFKKREEELIKLAKKMKQEDKASLEELLKVLLTKKAEVEESQTKLTSLENGTSDLFVASNQIQQRLTELEIEFGDIMSNYRFPDYRFKRDETVQRLLSSNADLGKLERTYRTKQLKQSPSKSSTQALMQDFRAATAKRLSSIDVKTKDDSWKSWITGLMFVRPHTLLMVVRNNCKIKAVDVRLNQVTTELKLTSDPWDITSLNGDQEAAVTLPEERQIQIISTTSPLSSLRSIKVMGKCWGISSNSQKIVVSFKDPAKVQVLDLIGKILSTIETDENGRQLFMSPSYLTVTTEKVEEVIYVTDGSTNIISKFTLDGKLISIYRERQWSGLLGVIAVGNNQLLICDYRISTLDVISEGGEVVTLLDSEKHGIVGPYSLCYCESEEKLYVGAGWSGYGEPLSVYKLTHT